MTFLKRYFKYVNDNDWMWFPLGMLSLVIVMIIILNLFTLPDTIHRNKESEMSQQELIITKKQSLVSDISNTATSVCRDYNNIDEVDVCMNRVVDTIQRVFENNK